MNAVVESRVKQLRAEEKAAAKATKREHEAELRRKAEVEIKREAAKSEQLEKANRMLQADIAVRDCAPVLTLEYKGIVIRAVPDAVLDPVAKSRGFATFKACHGILSADLERRRGAAQRTAANLEPLPTPSHDWLVKQVLDEARAAIKDGTVTVTTADTDREEEQS